MQNIPEKYTRLVKILERVLALIVFAGVIAIILASIPIMLAMDWSQTKTFYELIYRVFLAIIGLELIRMLITHELLAVLELLAFVIARKMLKPDLSGIDIALTVGSFVALILAYQFITEKEFFKKNRNI